MPEVARYPVPLQYHGETMANARPVELTLVQPASSQPDTEAVMHQNFHPSGAAVCEQISTARLRRTEHRYYSGPRGLGASSHVYWLGSEPDGVDANHHSRSRRKVAHAAALSVGQFTLTVPRGCWISTQIFDDAACEFTPASCMGNGINAGCGAVFFFACTRIHLWTRFALMLWLSAMLAIEAPGWAHS